LQATTATRALLVQQRRSSHTSSCSPATRKRHPGGRPRKRIAAGHHSSRCSTCSGTKKSGSLLSSSPAQMYQPVVSPAGGCRRPLIGRTPSRTFRAIPTLSHGNDATNATPYRRQTSFCARVVSSTSVVIGPEDSLGTRTSAAERRERRDRRETYLDDMSRARTNLRFTPFVNPECSGSPSTPSSMPRRGSAHGSSPAPPSTRSPTTWTSSPRSSSRDSGRRPTRSATLHLRSGPRATSLASRCIDARLQEQHGLVGERRQRDAQDRRGGEHGVLPGVAADPSNSCEAQPAWPARSAAATPGDA
jgi:hypothetical protein